MAHEEQRIFCQFIKKKFPEYFEDVTVLDVGSLDINGSNKYLFFGNIIYLGIDVAPGNNVDIISAAHELALPPETFDTIISTECLEHDRYWKLTLKNAVRMLRPGGMLLTTCATTGRPEHGTRRTTPQDAPLLGQVDSDWSDYYRNLVEADFREALDIPGTFQFAEFSVADATHDLYFVGIKSGKFIRRTDRSVDSASHPFQSGLRSVREELRTTLAEVDRLRYDVSAMIQTNLHIIAERSEREPSDEDHRKRDALLAAKQQVIDELTYQAAQSAMEVDRTKHEIQNLRTQHDAVLHSTTWRLMAPLRKAASGFSPRQRSFVRRVGKSLYWAVTPHRMPTRMAFLKQRRRSKEPGNATDFGHLQTDASQAYNHKQEEPFHSLHEGGETTDKTFDPGFYRFMAGLGDVSANEAYKDYLKRGRGAGIYGSVTNIPESAIARNADENRDTSAIPLKASIGIVTYGTTNDQINRIIKSIQIATAQCCDTVDVTVRILDNGSPYDQLTLPTNVLYQASPKNIGFGEAHNNLMQESFANSADLYIAANPDGAFHPYCIKNLIEVHRLKNGNAVVEAAQFPEEHPKYYDPISLRSSWVSGACMLISRKIWDNIAGFDENIFLYCEDVDLSWRARKAGFETLTCPRALFWHDLSDREEEPWRIREVLISSRYLAHKWNNPKFKEWTENVLVDRGLAFSRAELPPLDDIPTITDGENIPDFSKQFHYAAVRWWS